MRKTHLILAVATGAAALMFGKDGAQASSHREAPFVTKNPKVDATDFYMFRSYETGRNSYVTLIANYIPLQSAYGGPNFFTMDPDALYEIHIDNNGDAKEDLTFQFRFTNTLKDIQLPVGPSATSTLTKQVSIPLTAVGAITAMDNSSQNVQESYTITMVKGDRRTGMAMPVTNMANGGTTFNKPFDNAGAKTFGCAGGTACTNYDTYAATFIYNIQIPGCMQPGKVFVGQRKDPFYVNLADVFDLINIAPVNVTGGCENGTQDNIKEFNTTSIALEVPISCLTAGTDPVIGGWTTASVRQARVINPKATYDLPSKEGGAWAQVSRLGSPLVNEVVIGVKDKDRFNSSNPVDDPQFLTYVTNPSLAHIIQLLFGSAAAQLEPVHFPRNDLVDVFLTGIPGVTAPANLTAPGEMLRLNTMIPVTAPAMQKPRGPLDGDLAGFPNGRRPYDDVTDIALQAEMGAVYSVIDPTHAAAYAPAGSVHFTDCARGLTTDYDVTFPYLKTPLPGGPFGG
jgi:hypothetical protein